MLLLIAILFTGNGRKITKNKNFRKKIIGCIGLTTKMKHRREVKYSKKNTNNIDLCVLIVLTVIVQPE